VVTVRRGVIVLIVGPDGAGKSTLARGLLGTFGTGMPTIHSHWRPEALPHPGALVGRRRPQAGCDPHARSPHGVAVSLALLGYFWLDFALGGWGRLRRLRNSGALVVVERGWWDIVVDPARYGLSVSPRLVWALGRLLPKPDVMLALLGEPELVARRKAELSAPEIARQNQVWLRMSIARFRADIDAAVPPHVALEQAVECVRRGVDDPAVTREASWASLPGDAWATASFRRSAASPDTREPRWWLPRSPRSAARAGLLLYHPMTTKGRLAWEASRALARVGGFRLLPTAAPPATDLHRALEGMLREVFEQSGTNYPFDPRSVAIAKRNRPGGFVVLLLNLEGRPAAVAKVALETAGRCALEREAASLERIAPHLPPLLAAPRVVAHGNGVLVLRAEAWRPRLRPTRLPAAVAFGLGAFFRAGIQPDEPTLGFAHGDAAPWNLFRTGDRWLLLDWEHATAAAAPFHDLFHFLVHAHSLLGRPARSEILAGLDGRGWVGDALMAYSDGAAVPAARASEFLREYICRLVDAENELVDAVTPGGLAAVGARRRLLAELR